MMCKKSILTVLLILCFGASAYAAPQAALVVGNPDLSVSFDGPVYDRLVSLGYQVTVYDDANVDNSDPNNPALLSTTNASAYDVVVISESCGSSAVTELAYADVPIMDQEAFGWSRKDYTTNEGKDWGPAFTLVDIVDDSHPITAGAGLSGQVLFFNEPGMAGTVIDVNGMAADAVSLVQVPDSNQVLVWVIEKGGVLATGDANDVAVNRICGFGAIPGNASDVSLLTYDGWALFDAAIRWLDPAPIVLPPMVAHWTMDDGAGEVVTDSAGINDGTMVGLDPMVAWIADGALDGAVSFDGIDGHNIVILDSNELDFGDEDFSISMMVRYPTIYTTQHRLISKGTFSSPGTGSRYEVYIKNSELRFEIDNGPANVKSSLKVDNTPLMTGEWIHVVAIRDAANYLLAIYVDGILQGTAAETSGDISNGEGMRIGASTNDDSTMMGDIDDVRIFPLALTEDEIVAIGSLY